MTIEQLKRLAANPSYILTPEQVARLEAAGTEKPKDTLKGANVPVKHATDFEKHDPSLEEESSDGQVS